MDSTDRQVLERIGVTVPTAAETVALTASQQRAHADHLAALRAASLTVDGFAAATELAQDTVRDRIEARTLWAFDGDTRIPGWELHDGGPLRGLDIVVPRIPVGTSPTAVDNMFSQPSGDLYIDGEQVSVVEWLRAGLDPITAAAVIGSPAELT
jgi:hypothetical protein